METVNVWVCCTQKVSKYFTSHLKAQLLEYITNSKQRFAIKTKQRELARSREKSSEGYFWGREHNRFKCRLVYTNIKNWAAWKISNLLGCWTIIDLGQHCWRAVSVPSRPYLSAQTSRYLRQYVNLSKKHQRARVFDTISSLEDMELESRTFNARNLKNFL